MALSGLAVWPRRLDPGRRPERSQGSASRRARRGAPRGPAAAPRRPRRRRPAPRPPLRGPLRLRPRRRPQRRGCLAPRTGGAYAPPVRILLVSQMYPGPDAPDLGTFVAQLERELVARGNDVDLAVLDTRAGGKLRYLTLARRTVAARRPDVVYAHFLVPSGLIALAGRAPLVVTAHGRDVRNVGAIPGIAAATRLVVRRASVVVCVSEYLRGELEAKIPEARGKTEVVSSGVDLDAFAVAPSPDGPPRFLCVGALEE